jgi:hypothetical protein
MEVPKEFVQKVADAWNIPGPRPDIHMQAQMKLKKEWPTLWLAVRNLAKVAAHK